MDESAEQLLPAMMDYASIHTSCDIALRQFKNGHAVHAYLLSGARGLGKATFAKVLTSALFCLSENKPCGQCSGCKQVLSGTNPDVTTISPEGVKQISVDQVRSVLGIVAQHAFGAGHRVVIIEPAESMTPQAQNCLLKSLEEPMENVVFLLVAHEMTALLGTISSRCARVKLMPWTDAVLTTTLATLGYEAAEISRTLPMCSGNIGKAIELLTATEQNGEMQAWLATVLTASGDRDVVRISTGMKEDRENAERYLLAMEQALHHALMVRTKQMHVSALSIYPKEWQDLVVHAPVQDLTGLIHNIAMSRRLKSSQVNWQSTIDHLMIKMLEERIKWRQLLA